MKSLTDIQKLHRVFIIRIEWDNSKTPLEAVALIHEEAAELGHELRANSVNFLKVGDELADVILRSIDLASDLGIDIQLAVERKVEYNLTHIDEIKAKGRRK